MIEILSIVIGLPLLYVYVLYCIRLLLTGHCDIGAVLMWPVVYLFSLFEKKEKIDDNLQQQ